MLDPLGFPLWPIILTLLAVAAVCTPLAFKAMKWAENNKVPIENPQEGDPEEVNNPLGTIPAFILLLPATALVTYLLFLFIGIEPF